MHIGGKANPMKIELANAPCSWGIEDATNPANPPWHQVLKETAKAGYTGIETGPYGYLPNDMEVLMDTLQQNGMQIVAGTLYEDLVAEESHHLCIEKTKKICALLLHIKTKTDIHTELPPYLVIIDSVKKERNNTAGNPEGAPRLSKGQWKVMMQHIAAIAKIAASYDVRPVIHPHAGGYIEFADEIDQMLNDISPDLLGLCLDTGHLHYSQMDPAQWLKLCDDRVEYIHFKDINRDVYQSVLERHIGFFEACLEQVMCPIGQGDIDYRKILTVLDAIGYEGWITLEQERDPLDAAQTYEDIVKSRLFLTELGYQTE